MPILFSQIHGEINISLHGALRKSAGKKTGRCQYESKEEVVKIYVKFRWGLKETTDPAELQK